MARIGASASAAVDVLALLTVGCCGKRRLDVVRIAELLELPEVGGSRVPVSYLSQMHGRISPRLGGPRAFCLYAAEVLSGKPLRDDADPIHELRRLVALGAGPDGDK